MFLQADVVENGGQDGAPGDNDPSTPTAEPPNPYAKFEAMILTPEQPDPPPPQRQRNIAGSAADRCRCVQLTWPCLVVCMPPHSWSTCSRLGPCFYA